MTFSRIGLQRSLIVVAIILLVTVIDVSAITGVFLEFILVGRIPFTEVVISFEGFFLGMLSVALLIAIYNLALTSLAKFTHGIRISQTTETEKKII